MISGIYSASNVVSFGFFHVPELANIDGASPEFPHIQTAIVNTAVYPPEELFLRQNLSPDVRCLVLIEGKPLIFSLFQSIPLYYSTPEDVGKPGFIISPLFLHPRSRGTVRLASSDPMEPPLIDPNFLGNEIDVMIYAKGNSGRFTM